MKKGAVKQPKGARDVACEVLLRVETEAGFSPILLQSMLQNDSLNSADRGLATELVYGTLQWRGAVDASLLPFLKKGMAGLEAWVQQLLRLSVYQLLFLDRIPDHAAVNEAVQIARRRGHEGLVKLVNGVLRSWLRQNPDEANRATWREPRRAFPEWIVKQWTKQWGPDQAEQMIHACVSRAESSVRFNPLRADRVKWLSDLIAQGYEVNASKLSSDGYRIRGGAMPMQQTEWFTKGICTMQDDSSMVVASAVKAREGQRVLDACAAPGGKTTHLAQRMNDRGEIIALDPYPHKQALIENNAKRLGLHAIRTMVMDAREAVKHFESQSFDRVLIDAPCDGSGVYRRKPERKWLDPQTAIQAQKDLCILQAELLDSLAPLVKADGYLIYSTCSVDQKENVDQVRAFLTRNKDFELESGLETDLIQESPEFDWHLFSEKRGLHPGMIQLLPHDADSDGFFIARMRRLC